MTVVFSPFEEHNSDTEAFAAAYLADLPIVFTCHNKPVKEWTCDEGRSWREPGSLICSPYSERRFRIHLNMVGLNENDFRWIRAVARHARRYGFNSGWEERTRSDAMYWRFWASRKAKADEASARLLKQCEVTDCREWWHVDDGHPEHVHDVIEWADTQDDDFDTRYKVSATKWQDHDWRVEVSADGDLHPHHAQSFANDLQWMAQTVTKLNSNPSRFKSSTRNTIACDSDSGSRPGHENCIRSEALLQEVA